MSSACPIYGWFGKGGLANLRSYVSRLLQKEFPQGANDYIMPTQLSLFAQFISSIMKDPGTGQEFRHVRQAYIQPSIIYCLIGVAALLALAVESKPRALLRSGAEVI